MLKEERILPTKSGQAFEAMTILSKAKAIAVIAQKHARGMMHFE